VRFTARSDKTPSLTSPSPKRVMREKVSLTANPVGVGVAINKRQFVVPKSMAAKTGDRGLLSLLAVGRRFP